MEAKKQLEKITESELKEFKADLEKCKAKGDYPSLAKQLKVLKRKAITRDLLSATLIGKTMTMLSKVSESSDEDCAEVRKLSNEILEEWKRISKQEKDRKPDDAVSMAGASEETKTTATMSTESWKDGSMVNGAYIPNDLQVKTLEKQRDTVI